MAHRLGSVPGAHRAPNPAKSKTAPVPSPPVPKSGGNDVTPTTRYVEVLVPPLSIRHRHPYDRADVGPHFA